MSFDPIFALALFTLTSVVTAAAIELRSLREDQRLSASRVRSERRAARR
jgi:hypothetical protein